METQRVLTLLFVLFSLSYSLRIEDLPSQNEIPNGGKIWVVLVAGSNGYYNYRHQADVCHAYQVVHNHGVPDENIIVMMYDDIANNRENPLKGMIFNEPNGTDVYHGVPKDYTGKDVSNQTFIDVLLGKSINYGSGKTLMSGPKDHVFVYFSDHGAVGLVAFPDTLLHATTLNNALKTMHSSNQYAKMTLYIEACESGSMFKGLLKDNLNIYATTASNATTSSYACYYDDLLRTFLADVYSVKWLEDSDRKNLMKETLEQQYKVVKRETNTSQVCQFGDMSISKMKVADFQGEKEKVDFISLDTFKDPINKVANFFNYYKEEVVPPNLKSCGRDAVPGPEVPRIILEKRLQSATSDDERNEIRKELKTLLDKRNSMVSLTKNIINHVTKDDATTQKIMTTQIELTQFDCHKIIVDAFHEKCFNLGCNGYALRQINHFATICEMGYESNDILQGIQKHCIHEPVCGVH